MVASLVRQRRTLGALVAIVLLGSLLAGGPGRSLGQDDGGPSSLPADADMTDAPTGSAANARPADPSTDAGGTAADQLGSEKSINILTLLVSGGAWMIPIAVLSLVAVTFAIERSIGLRRSRVLPAPLVAGLGQISSQAGFDPRQAYRLCQQHPSAAATVIRAMLLKVGRPHSEVEHAVAEASEREANRLYANVRWLNLASGLGPLLGLLGTVWGMIVAFHDSTLLAPGQNKAEFLAEGIYIALVTTLAGLCVAIPSAFFAHWFEGRIQTLFHEIDELLFNLLPQVERYEGRVRFSRQMGEVELPRPESPAPSGADNRADSRTEGRTVGVAKT